MTTPARTVRAKPTAIASSRPRPAPAQGLGSGVQAVVAGANHACALAGSAVRGWGDH